MITRTLVYKTYIHKKTEKINRFRMRRISDIMNNRLSKDKLTAAFVQQKLDTIIAELRVGWPDKCVISRLRNALPHKNEAKVVKSIGLRPVFKFTSDKSIPF